MLIIGSIVKNMPGSKLGAGAGAAGMDDLGRVVEDPAEAVAAEIADHRITLRLGMALDGVADVAEPVAGPGLPRCRASCIRR